ncbi:SHD1 domain-containing protein [Rhodopirellula europaea]|uniref:Putative secreted protein n=1 Tax=Rhodopirellula europaea 6C TaxID=1263867 RepID=M2AA74_9BACT|nr:SHD1 domain-containing protein [Rhodopirellula europaea]EMB19246.1 putative secreted protein [Rhodopirellula europaea 6C]
MSRIDNWQCSVIAIVAGAFGMLNVASGQDVVYAPAVGETFDYGIEYRIVERTEGGRNPIMVRQRCRLRYVVKSSDSEEWSGTYQTIPFMGNKLANKGTLANHHRRTRESYESGPSNSFGSASGDPGMARFHQAASERAEAMRKEQQRRTLYELERYPGLFQFCGGEIWCTTSGKIRGKGAKGELPFATGAIAGLIFLQLPNDGKTVSGFSSRAESELNFVSSDSDQVAKSRISIFSLMTPQNPMKEGHLAFGREVEIAGGVSAGQQLTLSGSGMWEFSPEMGMPYAGSVDYKIDGASYIGKATQFDLRVGFHYLDPIRAMLFDHDLLPTMEAFDAANLPRLTSKQQADMAKYWEPRSKKSVFRPDRALGVQYTQIATNSAPPPANSRLQRLLEKELEDDSDWTNDIQFEQILSRWDSIRKAATKFPREWSDPSGTFTIKAMLQSVGKSDVSLLRLDNRQTISVPLEKLSEDDVEFARTFGILHQ